MQAQRPKGNAIKSCCSSLSLCKTYSTITLGSLQIEEKMIKKGISKYKLGKCWASYHAKPNCVRQAHSGNIDRLLSERNSIQQTGSTSLLSRRRRFVVASAGIFHLCIDSDGGRGGDNIQVQSEKKMKRSNRLVVGGKI